MNSYWSKTPVSSRRPSVRGERVVGLKLIHLRLVHNNERISTNLGFVVGLFTICSAKEEEPYKSGYYLRD